MRSPAADSTQAEVATGRRTVARNPPPGPWEGPPQLLRALLIASALGAATLVSLLVATSGLA